MDPLAVVLLRRTGRVAVDIRGEAPDDGAGWVAALEADLAERGWVLRDDLRTAATAMPSLDRIRWADWLLATVDEMAGADRPMAPLYRRFPDTPRDTDAVYVQRLLAHLFAMPGAPCVLCGDDDQGEPLDPCGHLVCPKCFSPYEVSACPICGRRLTGDNDYLTIAEPATATAARTPPPWPMRLAALETDPRAAAVRLRDQLVARPAALSEADRADLRVLIGATVPGRLDWLPAEVPVRETLAVVIAWALLDAPLELDELLAAAGSRWDTATDVARTLWAYSGGDPGLVLPRKPQPGGPRSAWRPGHEPVVAVPAPRVRALPRPLRRAVLAHLDARGTANAAEDMLRHPAIWKRLAERLHPFEQVTAHPAAAVAFAALRASRTPREGALGAAILAAFERDPEHLTLTTHPDDRIGVRLRTHASLVERAVADGDVPEAVRLLAQRPGELWRRVDQLLRASDDPAPVLAALKATAGRVSAGVLASAAAALAGRDRTVRANAEQLAATATARAGARARTERVHDEPLVVNVGSALREATRRLLGGHDTAAPDAPETGGIVGGRPGPGMPRRVFFPRGSVTTTWTEPERRARLTVSAIQAVRETVDAELTARAARLGRFDVALIDEGLAEVPAPMRERAASAQTAGWPRGSVRELPEADVLRLFLHWEEPAETRVDLDLSCVFFDARWRRIGHCDYTELRFRQDAAVHSGDLTSAPGPLGATEFLDLDLTLLRVVDVRYVVPTVLSFNAVPFEQMTEAFAGLMLPEAEGAQFDGARVLQRFALSGDARMMMPMVIDVEDRRLLWTDLTLPGGGYGHSVGRHVDQMARAAADQWDHFTGGHRTRLLDLARWHAAGRAGQVLSVGDDRPDLSGSSVLAAVVDASSLPSPVGPGSVALTVTGRAAEPWTQVAAADLLGELSPGE
ncbi:hypothetical protein KOI35_14590 [Actinoplanes bogorensis]|uniref:RING-type domain-containing protein n=1 Tax=Paractinoplanes bogorensis TaxID=1610840 RepID=A0ABS5YPU6_9ACTN|nr:MXAN_6230/SCO0854 family RING domain-containing protein [Actinoplanes bogorensis]MBU2664728.1 hypothetical protein [Actinoplanes bogorensis]